VTDQTTGGPPRRTTLAELSGRNKAAKGSNPRSVAGWRTARFEPARR
jgi:hypothetical protein